MKWFILAFVVALSTQAFGKWCAKNEECEEDQCCVTYFGWGSRAEHYNNCENLQDIDKPCRFPDNEEQVPDTYFQECPCKKGLKCEYTSQLIHRGSITPTNPRCRVPKNN